MISPEELPEYIGVGRMETDGTIVLRLTRSVGTTVVHDELRYQVSNPNYAAVLKHIGPIRPGESVSVKPWKEK